MGVYSAKEGNLHFARYPGQEMFRQGPDRDLTTCNAIRECSSEVPVIIAIDVTDSMFKVVVDVGKKIINAMVKLFENINDIAFMVMGIGDLAYDVFPMQATQFENDIRIVDQLDMIYIEGGGGGNICESYSAAWYFGVYHTKLDCWKRGKKGIIITIGDEALNTYLPIRGRYGGLKASTGDEVYEDIETKDVYNEAIKKFDIYHLAVDDRNTSFRSFKEHIQKSFRKYLDDNHYREVALDDISDAIIDIVKHFCSGDSESYAKINKDGLIFW